jgi:ferrous iron transport protein A
MMYNFVTYRIKQMNLLEITNGKRGTITGFSGGNKIKTKLTQYGIFPGDSVEVLRTAPFDGPVLLRINGREIALGKGIAGNVQVEGEA